MIAVTDKKIIIIAGPNGAGKTTFAGEFLPNEADCPNFVNADLIAAGLAPFVPDTAAFRAGRVMITEIHNHIRLGESFAFETTLSGRHYAQLIPHWQSSGYRVKLFFLKLVSPELAIARVRATGPKRRSQCTRTRYPASVCSRTAQFFSALQTHSR